MISEITKGQTIEKRAKKLLSNLEKTEETSQIKAFREIIEVSIDGIVRLSSFKKDFKMAEK